MASNSSFQHVLRTWVEVFMHRSFRDFRRFMEGAGLSHSQVGALMRLHHLGSCGVSDIAGQLGITVAAASQMVDRLVQQGLLERAEDPSDRRFKQVSLTPKGKALIESGVEYRQRWMELLTQALTQQEQETVSGALSLLTQAALKLDPDESGEGKFSSTCSESKERNLPG
jgi:DNA-binding MarR family transcriptional regulator